MHTLDVNNHVKVRNIKCKFKHQMLTIVTCGSYMLEFSVSRDMKSMVHKKGGGSREGSGTFMPYTNCQGFQN